ncbi:MAG: ABC transporter permease [Chloroflexi bacterium]|nr:MAG: ABC transporter permease [Chloroflexota bacterium]
MSGGGDVSRTKKSSKGRVKESASSTPTDVAPQNAGDSAEAHQRQVAARIRAGLFAIFAAVSVLITSGSFGVDGNFAFWSDSIGGEQVFFSVPVALLWGIVSVGFIAITLFQLLRGARFAWRASIGIIAPALVIALLARLLDGTTANLTVFFTSTLSFAIPVGIGALAGIVSERSGILNIAVEGKLLSGAMVGSIASSITGVAVAGPVAGALIGALLSLFLAWLGIRYKVDQIIAGTVINIGALGITSFAYLRILQPYSEYNRPIGIDTVDIPLLSSIPILGPIFFSLSPYFYASVGLILFFTYMVYRTRWGLRLRAAGEQPSAAGTVGVDVVKLRYRAMLIAGLLAGFAGSYIALSGTGGFGINTSAGKGFIALAAVIFGAWNPIYAFGAALIFGMTSAATTLLSGLGVSLPPQILLSMPYIVTIIVVAGLIGRVRAPASAGRPYDQG